jgi:hypothetical protein
LGVEDRGDGDMKDEERGDSYQYFCLNVLINNGRGDRAT